MAKIVYITHDGVERAADVMPGYSVMHGAVINGIPGIDGACGGHCACGTCHVYIGASWCAFVGEPDMMERNLLQLIAEAAIVTDLSRLSCQIE